MPVMNMFPGGSTLQIPLDAPTSFSATAGNAQVELTWTDPLDKYATPEGEVSETGDQLVSEWDHTVLVRKTGSQPVGPNDGTVVVSSSVRNQYQTAAYVDSGLTNDTTYYYGVFAYNKDGVASSGAFVNATPKSRSPVLNENTWDIIQEVAAEGSASSLWAVGDCKELVLNGAFGGITLTSYAVCAFILGFNHNAALEGNNTIHFQFGKTALTGGTDICFFSDQMNTANTNEGGWASSNMRNNILGTDPDDNGTKFMGALPADLRAALKSVQKYTNNVGASTLQSAVTATTDYLFIPAEFEVFGTRKYANTFEQDYQEQYAYYASGNSKVKYEHDSPGIAATWWERSPYASGQYYFCYVDAGGSADFPIMGDISAGIAPAFVVG